MSSNCTFGTTPYKTRRNNPTAYNTITQNTFHPIDYAPTKTIEIERPSIFKTKPRSRPQSNITKSCDTLRDIAILGAKKAIEKEGRNMCKQLKMNENTCVNDLKALSKEYITQNYTKMIDNKTCTFKTLHPINPLDFVDAQVKKNSNNATLKNIQMTMNTKLANHRQRINAQFNNIVDIGCKQFTHQSNQMEASGKAMGIGEEDRKVIFGLLNPGFEPLYRTAKAQCKKNELKTSKQ